MSVTLEAGDALLRAACALARGSRGADIAPELRALADCLDRHDAG